MNTNYEMRTRNDGIVVFRIPDLTREVVDLWIEDLRRLGNAWIKEETALMLVELYGLNAATPYIKTMLSTASHIIPATQKIRTAFLVDKGPGESIWQRSLKETGSLLGEKKIFTREDKAVEWLLEVL